MKQRLFKYFFLTAMAVFLVCVTVFTVLLLLDMNDVNRQHLNAEASLAAAVLQSGGQGALETVSLEDSRIRWLGQDGAVLYDSAPDLRPLASQALEMDDGTVLEVSNVGYTLPHLLLQSFTPLLFVAALAVGV